MLRLLLSCALCVAVYPHAEAQEEHWPNVGYLGKGYNVFFGNPLQGHFGAENTILDPGFKSPVFDTTHGQTFDAIKTSSSSEQAGAGKRAFSSLREYSKALDATFDIPLLGFLGRFQASLEFREARTHIESSFSRFFELTWQTTEYQATINSNSQLSSGFIASVKSLPMAAESSEDRSKFFDFFDKYGTHYVEHVLMGGKAGMRAKVSAETYLANQQDDASITGQLGELFETGAFETDYSSETSTHGSFEASAYSYGGKSEAFEPGDLNKWKATVPANPMPLTYELSEIAELLTSHEDLKSKVSSGRLRKIKSAMTEMYKDYCNHLADRKLFSHESCVKGLDNDRVDWEKKPGLVYDVWLLGTEDEFDVLDRHPTQPTWPFTADDEPRQPDAHGVGSPDYYEYTPQISVDFIQSDGCQDGLTAYCEMVGCFKVSMPGPDLTTEEKCFYSNTDKPCGDYCKEAKNQEYCLGLDIKQPGTTSASLLELNVHQFEDDYTYGCSVKYHDGDDYFERETVPVLLEPYMQSWTFSALQGHYLSATIQVTAHPKQSKFNEYGEHALHFVDRTWVVGYEHYHDSYIMRWRGFLEVPEAGRRVKVEARHKGFLYVDSGDFTNRYEEQASHWKCPREGLYPIIVTQLVPSIDTEWTSIALLWKTSKGWEPVPSNAVHHFECAEGCELHFLTDECHDKCRSRSDGFVVSSTPWPRDESHDQEPHSHKKNDIWIIVGAVTGGLVIVIAAVIFVVVKAKKTRQASRSSDQYDNPAWQGRANEREDAPDDEPMLVPDF